MNVIVQKGKISYMYIKIKICDWFTGESRMSQQIASIGRTNTHVTITRIGCKDSSFRSLSYNLKICKRNQRTNGPVNAHLISGPTISTKRVS